MGHASAVLPLFTSRPLDLAPLWRVARQAGLVLAAVAQVVGFASVLWLAVAGPGFLFQHDSTVVVHRMR